MTSSKVKTHVVLMAIALTGTGFWVLYRPWLDVLWSYPVAGLCISAAFGAVRQRPWAAGVTYIASFMVVGGWVLTIVLYHGADGLTRPFGLALQGGFLYVGCTSILQQLTGENVLAPQTAK